MNSSIVKCFFDLSSPTGGQGAGADVKELRSQLLRFIKEQLQKLEGGEGAGIRSIHLFVACPAEEKHLYETIVYTGEEERFKNEVQKIADDFAIDLPHNWMMETEFVDSLPPEAIKVPNLDAALFIQTRKRSLQKSATACIRVLNGEAEKEEYVIHSNNNRINIGRDAKAQTDDGFFRINHIAFPANSQHESNRYISRQHAHITWDNENGAFFLYADEGGIPPRNKIKVKSSAGTIEKIATMEIGHKLQEGDQIILGETALLEFTYR
ncbi:MAG: FHA domain-containing protein [Flavisolibacter sp.]|nr:FHA domain-containing protein [Flavisolibacter sp.]